MIDPQRDWPWPTFAQLRRILLERCGCRIEAAPQNLVYKSSSSITVFARTDDIGNQHDWIAFHADDDLLSRRMVMSACNNLHITLEALDLSRLNMDPLP